MVSSEYVIPVAVGVSCGAIILVLVLLIVFVGCLICRVSSTTSNSAATARRAGSRLHSASSKGRVEQKPRPLGPTKKRKTSQTSQTLYEDLHYKDGRGLKLQGSGMGAINPIMMEDDEDTHADTKDTKDIPPHPAADDQDSENNPYD